MAGSPPVVTLDDILAIPGNQAVYEKLQGLLADGSAMAFVGAGASVPLYPQWEELIEKLAAEPGQHGLAAEADKKHWLRTAAAKPLQVAAQIHDTLKDQLYHTFLFETFKDRIGPDGRGFTPTHAAIVRANFKAVITTNYDPGLPEARRVLRPDIRDTGFAVWNQVFAVNRWASGDLFKDNPPCPILFAHGHYADPLNVVLDAASYRNTYHNTPYRRLFENLWFQQNLVFVGFSLNDIVLAQIADEVLSQTARRGGSGPRHIAILGLPIENEYTQEMRHEYSEPFNAEVLFYPVRKDADGHQDHSALQVVLDSLVAQTPVTPGGVVVIVGPLSLTASAAPLTVAAAPAAFIHERTDDEKFTGRDHVLDRLDTWAKDPGVRLIGITAIGGLGKTALVGRWSKDDRATNARRAEGFFFWSYYRDHDTNAMLRALLEFGRKELKWETPESLANTQPIEQAMELLRQRRMIVALDGLEVVQESPGTVAYGKLLHPDLADLLHRHSRVDNGSLVVLTSRFPFPDLTPYLGGPLRTLPLPELEPPEGSALLVALGVGGVPADREEISRRLSGHPLALRIFARAIPGELVGDPTRLWKEIFDEAHLADEGSLGGKMKRLLTFYEQQLSESERLALGLLALFRAPVGERTLAVLWGRCRADTGAEGTSADQLRATLDRLHREHLLTADDADDGALRYACHPILRGHFRGRLLHQNALIRDAAKLLADQPDSLQPQTLDNIQLVVTAIEVLLEASEIKAASDLYMDRLDRGHAFLYLPTPHWGMEVARLFVRDEVRRRGVREQLGAMALVFYLSDVGLFASVAGEPETALEYYQLSEDLYSEARNWKNLSITLQNRCELEISLGLLALAQEHAAEALQLAERVEDDFQVCVAKSFAGFTSFLQSALPLADRTFVEANMIENRIGSLGRDLHSVRGIQWAEHMLRCGDPARARILTEANLEICLRHNLHQDVGRCEWMLGWLDTSDGGWDEAAGHLQTARTIFTRGHMIFDLARTLITESACRLGQGGHDAALTACERALQLAAPRNYRLVHADALIQRGCVRLAQPAPDAGRARDDAEAALQLAEFCGYAWGQRDANELLAIAYHGLGQPDESARYQSQAEQWRRRLTFSAATHAGEVK